MCIQQYSEFSVFRLLRFAVLLYLLGAQWPSAFAATPSFLCAKAKTWVEKVICDSDSLSGQDIQLAADYARILAKLSGDAAKQLATEQRAWWATRNECRDASDPVVCLWKKYEDRITELRIRPDFPAEITAPTTEFIEANVKDAASGWSKNLANYMLAIRACLPIAPVEIAAVSNAWFEQEEMDVAMNLLSTNGETWVCIAQRDGSRVIEIRQQVLEEKLRESGPFLYLGKVAPDARCGAIQVIDRNDQLVGWLANSLCQ